MDGGVGVKEHKSNYCWGSIRAVSVVRLLG